MAKISQAEARRLRKRVRELEQWRENLIVTWRHEYPDGVFVGIVDCTDATHTPTAVQTARRCGMPVIATNEGQRIKFFAVKP